MLELELRLILAEYKKGVGNDEAKTRTPKPKPSGKKKRATEPVEEEAPKASAKKTDSAKGAAIKGKKRK